MGTITTTHSDEDLIVATSRGDESAFAHLWERHYAAGIRVAGRYHALADPEDVTQEAFAQILIAASAGRVPTGPFRPYLFRVIRNIAVSSARRRRPVPAGGPADLEAHGRDVAEDSTEHVVERSFVVDAFRRLPQPWQDVLWYTVVEDLPPREVATRLGLTPNATSALAVRAREGLRQEWLAAHLNAAHPDACRDCLRDLPTYVRGRLAQRRSAQVRRHLAGCLRCTRVETELAELSQRLRAALIPLALGVAATHVASTGGGLSISPVPVVHRPGPAAPRPAPPRGPVPRPPARPGVQIAFAAWTALLVAAALSGSVAEVPAVPVLAAGTTRTPPALAGVEDAPPPEPVASTGPDPADPVPPTPDPGAAAPTPQDAVPHDNPQPRDPGTPAPVPPVTAVAPTISGPAPGWVPVLPTLSGTAAPGTTLSVLAGGTRTATVTADGAGNWTYAPPSATAGTYTFSVSQAAADGKALTSAVAGPYVLSTPAFAGASGGQLTQTRVAAGATGPNEITLTVVAQPGSTVVFAFDGTEPLGALGVPASGTRQIVRVNVGLGQHTASIRYVDPATGARGPATTVTVTVS